MVKMIFSNIRLKEGDLIGNVVIIKKESCPLWGRSETTSLRKRIFLIVRRGNRITEGKGYVGYPISIKPTMMHMRQLKSIEREHIERLATSKEVRQHNYKYKYKRKVKR